MLYPTPLPEKKYQMTPRTPTVPPHNSLLSTRAYVPLIPRW